MHALCKKDERIEWPDWKIDKQFAMRAPQRFNWPYKVVKCGDVAVERDVFTPGVLSRKPIVSVKYVSKKKKNKKGAKYRVFVKKFFYTFLLHNYH